MTQNQRVNKHLFGHYFSHFSGDSYVHKQFYRQGIQLQSTECRKRQHLEHMQHKITKHLREVQAVNHISNEVPKLNLNKKLELKIKKKEQLLATTSCLQH